MSDASVERTSHRILANGIDHAVHEWSTPAAGATALLLHGFADAGGTWEPVACELARGGLRVLAPDLRGFGESGRVPEGGYYHFPDYVADVASLLGVACPEGPLFVVGHSMGGSIATLFTGAFPERVTRLALLEGLGPPSGELGSMPDRIRLWIEQLGKVRRDGARAGMSVADALRRLAANHPTIDRAILERRLPYLVRDLGKGSVEWRFDPLHKTTGPTPFFAEGYMACARRVSCPVLHISGGAGGFHPPDEETRLEAFPHLERNVLEGAGHMMHWTRPLEVSEALLRFWRS